MSNYSPNLTDAGFYNYDDDVPDEFRFTVNRTNYILREPSEDVNVRLRTQQFRNARMTDGKITQNLDSLAESQVILLAGCVVYADGPNMDKLISAKDIKTWPSRVTKDVFMRARKMGRMDEEDTEENLTARIKELEERLDALRNGHTAEARSKNEPSATTATTS